MKVLLIVGPTAVGKTEISLRLARSLGGEIVSADSRQVYRYMDIGTAKPAKHELEQIPHHFIDVRNPDEYYSAGEYGREARACIKNLLGENKVPIVVGGSGFYIRALVDGLFAPRISDSQVKEKWRLRIRKEGAESAFAYLQKIDPQSAARLHPNDTQRVIRALEVYEISGTPISAFQESDKTPADFSAVFVGLTRKREILYERINSRVDKMIEKGLIDEVISLKKKGWGPKLNALRTVGYKEVFDFLDGAISKDEMIRLIKQSSRRYAKRQLTWFRRDSRIHWIDLDEHDEQKVLNDILGLFTSNS
ncbi:MAG: tRNA (adenosine(37)-N6)-dimethylallyltransferase MiaA [Calditrichaeota bacterium]|nr:tRNA (adenosine(37)-N6)-dimethylallyltransferase MiaA [Calditrichota bacterium]